MKLFCFFARSAKREGSRDRFFACVCTFYYEPCDLVRSIALGMDISELSSKVCHNSLTSLKSAVFCFHMSGFESSTDHSFFRTFRVFSFFGTFRAHPISTSEGSFCVRLLVAPVSKGDITRGLWWDWILFDVATSRD